MSDTKREPSIVERLNAAIQLYSAMLENPQRHMQLLSEAAATIARLEQERDAAKLREALRKARGFIARHAGGVMGSGGVVARIDALLGDPPAAAKDLPTPDEVRGILR